jgi:hypothetical protein
MVRDLRGVFVVFVFLLLLRQDAIVMEAVLTWH